MMIELATTKDRQETGRIPSNRILGIFKWFGGKGHLLKRIMPFIPKGGNPYTEAYAGGANILLNREPAPVEAINDLDDRIVNIFRVLQSKRKYRKLKHMLLYTPYSRSEFVRAINIINKKLNGEKVSSIRYAWAFFVVQNQGFSGTNKKSSGDWSRTIYNPNKTCTLNKSNAVWINKLKFIDIWHQRLMRVQIDQKDAIEFLKYWDTSEAVHYIDPPYYLETRKGKQYRHEADYEHYQLLLETILNLKGSVTLSGYNHAIYKPLEKSGWKRIDFPTACYAAGRTRTSGIKGKGSSLIHSPRVECIWINPKAQENLK